jgi:hypothetical protein
MIRHVLGIFLILGLMAFMGCNGDPDDGTTAVRTALTGNVSVTGSFNEGTAFRANTIGLGGVGVITLQWQISEQDVDEYFANVSAADGALSTEGSITNNIFTPAVGTANKFIRLRATRAGNTGQIFSLSQKILADGVTPVVTGVTVSPASIDVQKGATQHFTHTVLGTDVDDVQNVTWSIVGSPSAGTSITANGTLSIARNEALASLSIRATSNFNTEVSGTATAYIVEYTFNPLPDDTDYPAVRTGEGVYFLAPDGNDTTGDGSKEFPWQTFRRAQMTIQAGDTIYIRGGRYRIGGPGEIPADNIPCGAASRSAISLVRSGEPGKPIAWSAYPPDLAEGNRPIFDLTNFVPTGTGHRRVTGIVFGGVGQAADGTLFTSATTSVRYNILYGIDVTGIENYETGIATNGYVILIFNASHNTIENCRFYMNAASGVFIREDQVCSYNLIKNCDNFNNYSTRNLGMNMNNDGFGAHGPNGSVGNVFYGCRSWVVCDDGFDAIHNFETTVFDRCWSAYTSYRYKDSTTYADWTTTLNRDLLELVKYNYGRGNGVKGGGWNMHNDVSSGARGARSGTTQQVARFCLAIGSRNAGITTNFHWGGNYFSYNTAWNNNDNFDFMMRAGKQHTANNNNSLSTRVRNNRDIFATGNISIPGGPLNTGFNVVHLDIESGIITAEARSHGMREAAGREGMSQIWNNSWDLRDNGAKNTHGLANWIEGIMLHNFYQPAPDLWTGEPWPTSLRSTGPDGGTTYAAKDSVLFPQGASGTRNLAWDLYGKWNNWEDKYKDIVQNAIGMSDNDFMSFNEDLFLTPRKRNGDLPDIAFLRPIPGSPPDGLGYTAPDNNIDGFMNWKYISGATPTMTGELKN